MKALPLGPDPALNEGACPSQGRRAHPMRRADVLGPFALFVAVLAGTRIAASEPAAGPPPRSLEYFQYGAALVGESLGSAGDVCPPDANTPCILGSGGGLAIRVGYRTRGAWFFGGAYEFSRHDSSNLLRLAILQQLRGEARYYLDHGTRLTPYGALAAGGVLYGSEWGAETGGLVLSVG